MLLIMGLGAQMILWSEELCKMFVERGFFVIRFDNRDCGRSTKIEGSKAPSLTRLVAGDKGQAPYLLADMADDTVGLLDALGIKAAHLVGASLGGFVAQTVAIRHPDRVLSLASIMSSTGGSRVGYPHPSVLPALLSRPPKEKDAYVENFLKTRAAIGSPGLPADEARMRRLGERYFDRGSHPDGTLRQLAASIASGNRTADLEKLDVPTVVIHGERDPLIDVSGGKATAAAVPGAELLLIPQMGHDLPPVLYPRIVDAVVANTERSRKAR